MRTKADGRASGGVWGILLVALLTGCGAGRTIPAAEAVSLTSWQPAGMEAETAIPADAVVDSVGINVHLSYTETPYADFAMVESKLLALGVRHLRDGMGTPQNTAENYFAEHNRLGQLGINSIFIAGVGQSAASIQSYPGLMAQCFEGFENPNEYDDQGIANWRDPLLAEVQTMAGAELGGGFPVIGPSLVFPASYPELGDVSAYVNYGNSHDYPGGHNPGNDGWGDSDAEGNAYGSMQWNLDQVGVDAPGIPHMSTETGYTNDLSSANGVPQPVAAVYLPRLLLEHWLAGYARTYLYELVSEGGEDYGLLNGDWSAKPAFGAVSNLLNLLADKGAAFQAGSLTYGMTGGDGSLHHLLMQKRDGSYYLALWLEESSYDMTTRTAVAVAPETITLQLPAGAVTTGYQWDAMGGMTPVALAAGSPVSVTVTDKLLVLRIVP